MKSRWVISFMVITVCFTVETKSQTNAMAVANAAIVKTTRKMPPETVNATVIRVYSFHEGVARFRAYVVTWKGQEVIVSDMLARTDYKEGETIPFLVTNHPESSLRSLNFWVVQPRQPDFPCSRTTTNQTANLDFIHNGMTLLNEHASKADNEKLRKMAAERIERVDAPVIKVYSAHDVDARFQAYIVKWRNQEVVVSDTLARTDDKVGDTIEFLMMRLPPFRQNDKVEALRFEIEPPLQIQCPTPPTLPITASQMPDVGRMSGAILDKLNESWRKKDLSQLSQEIDVQYSTTPNFVPALLAKTVYFSLVESQPTATAELLKRVDNLMKEKPSKRYEQFREALRHSETAIASIHDKDKRADALFLIFPDCFPLAGIIKKVGCELQITPITPLVP